MGPARHIARRLRQSRSKARVLAFGPLVDVFHEEMTDWQGEFDGLCLSDAETTLLGLAERLDRPSQWSRVPNFVPLACEGKKARLRLPGTSLATLPEPVYTPEVYPAMRGEEKLKFFEIEDVRGTRHHTNASPRFTPDNTLRMKPVSVVCDEMWRLGSLFGAHAFHFVGPGAPASHMNAVALEVMRRGMRVRYSRTANIELAVPESYDTLASSGCMSMSYRIDTGSQRLLDDYYGNPFTVTHAETVLRACREAGMYTIAQLTYPCPADDYHTRCETLRLMARTAPSAAPVTLPQVLPQSAWHRRPKAFGFRVDQARLLENTVRMRRRAPMQESRWRKLPFAIGSLSASQVMAEHDELVKDLQELQIAAVAPESLTRLARIAGYSNREDVFVSRVRVRLIDRQWFGDRDLSERV